MLMRLNPDGVIVEVTPLVISVDEGFWTPGNVIVFRKPFLPERVQIPSHVPPGEWIGYTHGILVQIPTHDEIVCVPYTPTHQMFYSVPLPTSEGHPIYLVGLRSHFLPYRDYRQNFTAVAPRHDWYSVYDPNTQTRSWRLVWNMVDAPDGFLYGEVVIEDSSGEPRVCPVHCGGAHSHGWSL